MRGKCSGLGSKVMGRKEEAESRRKREKQSYSKTDWKSDRSRDGTGSKKENQ